MQLKYQQQAADLELTMKLNPISNGTLWYYDSDRIEQVLTNLIDNACRYTEPGSWFCISTCIINQIRKHLFNSIRIIIPERSIRNRI